MKYLDRFGLPVTKYLDGGDSCAIAGTVETLRDTKDPAKFNLTYFFVNGNLVRHPDSYKWYGRPNRFSRDQLIPLLCALGMNKNKQNNNLLSLIFKRHLKHGLLFTWNTIRNFVYDSLKEHLQRSTPDVPYNRKWKLPDFTGPEVWALWIRSKRMWYLYPLLYIFDLETLIGSFLWKNKDSNISRNHLLVLYFSNSVYQTYVSRAALKTVNVAELIEKWKIHCLSHYEYETYSDFEEAYKRKGLIN